MLKEKLQRNCAENVQRGKKERCTKLAANLCLPTCLGQQLYKMLLMRKVLMMKKVATMMMMVVNMMVRRRVTLPSRALMAVGKMPKQQLE